MKEDSLWRSLREDAKRRDEVTLWKRHQSPFQAGRPDVSWRLGMAAGQLELKAVNRPARKTTNIWVPVTPLQRRTLREWQGPQGHGLAFVLLALDRDWLLLDPRDLEGAAEHNASDHPGFLEPELEDMAVSAGTTSDWVPLYQGLWEQFLERASGLSLAS